MIKCQRCSLSIGFAIFWVACDRPVPVHNSSPSSSAPPSAPPVATAAIASGTVKAPSPATSSLQQPFALGVTTFDNDLIGMPSPSFEPVVGDWYVAEVSGARGLKVDGGKWKHGSPSANLADQAKHLYGDRYAEFLDGVKAFAFFPFSVWTGAPPTGDVRVSVRFYPEAGKIDQAAGIAFGIAMDGSYFGVRANALEENLLYFRVVKGRRNIIDTVRGVPTSSSAWHTLAIELRGTKLTADVDGSKKFEKNLEARPAGNLGLWSKSDSQVVFDDFTVRAL